VTEANVGAARNTAVRSEIGILCGMIFLRWQRLCYPFSSAEFRAIHPSAFRLSGYRHRRRRLYTRDQSPRAERFGVAFQIIAGGLFGRSFAYPLNELVSPARSGQTMQASLLAKILLRRDRSWTVATLSPVNNFRR
jgi:hypothetical protein